MLPVHPRSGQIAEDSSSEGETSSEVTYSYVVDHLYYWKNLEIFRSYSVAQLHGVVTAVVEAVEVKGFWFRQYNFATALKIKMHSFFGE